MSRRSRSPQSRSNLDGKEHRSRDYRDSHRSSRRDERDRYERSDLSSSRRNPDSRRKSDQEDERDRDRRREREVPRGSRETRDRGGSSRRSASPRRPRSPPSRNSPRARSKSASPDPPAADKTKPNFANSGLLAAATNTVKGTDGTSTVLKYNEPPEARKPIIGWRLYVFKGSEQVELLHIQRQSAYLIGRDRLVADISVDHPSCSKQHAVIQYRQVYQKDELGNSKGVVKPFVIDLESTNGTHVNDEAIPVSRYYELKAGDVIKFGQSTREYVLLHDDAS